MRVLLATRSRHKLREIGRMVAVGAPGVEIVGPDAVGLPHDPAEEGIEVHESFEENALAKARWFRSRSGLPTLADDSGLVVDALGGAPGVRSRRFAPDAPQDPELQDRANNEYLLRRLEGIPEQARTARYVCVLVFLPPDDSGPILSRGEAQGRVLEQPRGWEGFGYDPLILDPLLGRTYAEMSPEEKDARSHRGGAFRAMMPHLAFHASTP